jgi:dTDP-glucose pyrophosphorylase
MIKCWLMSKLNLVLPAAGLGSRFLEVGELRPKPLIPVFEIPMIVWVLMNFPLESTDKVWIVSQKKDGLPEMLADVVSKIQPQIAFLEIEGVTEGPAATVSLVLENLPDDEALIVANTDQFVFADLAPFVNLVRSGPSEGLILTMNANSDAWSYVGRNSSGQITDVVEKVQISNEATVGVYGWSRAGLAKMAFAHTFEQNLRTNNEFYVAPTYNFLISEGHSVDALLIGDHGVCVHGLGTPRDLAEFLTNSQAKSATLRLKMELGFSESKR